MRLDEDVYLLVGSLKENPLAVKLLDNQLYILSCDVNEQLMIVEQKTHMVKERAHPYLQLGLVHVTRLDKWSHNNTVYIFQIG